MNKPTQAYNIELSENNTNKEKGWCFGLPVGIKTEQWPRSRVNGLPMAHIWTFFVPEPYRTKGTQYVAISLFQADDHVAEIVDGVEAVIKSKITGDIALAKDFWNSLLIYSTNKHQMERYYEDEIGGGWALIWLTHDEFKAENTPIPDKLFCVYPEYQSSDGINVYLQNEPPKYIDIIERTGDPNIGKNIEEFPDKKSENAYIPLFTIKSREMGLDEKFWGKSHYGGTSSPCQGEPSFSPFYIEFDEKFGGANLGGDGVAQIDLLNDELNWACG